jgi:hypothetical protein
MPFSFVAQEKRRLAAPLRVRLVLSAAFTGTRFTVFLITGSFVRPVAETVRCINKWIGDVA